MLAFQKACTDVAVAQWLVSLGGVHMHARRDGAFRWACQNGHLAVAQWLITLSGVNIHAFHDYAFRAACSKGHLQVAQWLFFLGGVDSHILDRKACGRSKSGAPLETPG
jgi:hypothetical protein